MAQINPGFEAQVRAEPYALYQIIVRVQGNLDERQTQLKEDGLVITRVLKLVHGFAGTAQGETIKILLNYDWVASIESDKPVHTMSGNS